MIPTDLTAALKEEARRIGFDLVGAAPVTLSGDLDRLEAWHMAGNAAEMHFFARRQEAYRDINLVLEGARSVLMLAMSYKTVEPAPVPPGTGRIARYAWGKDYHGVIAEMLRKLERRQEELVPTGKARGVVDTAPVLERAFARRAGLGSIGKNNLLINEKYGSWLFLAALLTTETLEYDAPVEKNDCGECRACLDACPTNALYAPFQLDARKCLSYLSIEHRGEVPQESEAVWGDRLLGCDACQDACPWNRRAESGSHPEFAPAEGRNPQPLDVFFQMDETAFKKTFADSPLSRAKLAGMIRNATIVKKESGKDMIL